VHIAPCTLSILFFYIKWFARIIDNIIERHQLLLEEILQLQRELKSMIENRMDNFRAGLSRNPLKKSKKNADDADNADFADNT